MTQEQRAALRALAEKATPGPWRADEYDCGDVPHWNGVSAVLASEEMDCAIVHWAGFAQEYWRSARGDKEIAANAAFIAAANPAAILSLLDALAAAEARAVVPAGWKLVPASVTAPGEGCITAAMESAGERALVRQYDASDWETAKDLVEQFEVRSIYRAMIAAAPPPPAAGDGA